MAADLTRAQRDMLELLCGESTNVRAVGTWWSASSMLPHLYEHHGTYQGATMTAASLVRRGFLEKARAHYDRAIVVYRITGKGREMVAALRSLDKAADR